MHPKTPPDVVAHWGLDHSRGGGRKIMAAAPEMLEALKKIARSLDAEISSHRCSCTHPCDDYFVHPGPCGTRRAETYRNIKAIADKAIAKAEGKRP